MNSPLVRILARMPRFLRVAALVAAAPFTLTAEQPARAFDIPAEDAAVALQAFAEQSGEEIVYPAADVRGTTTNAVKGEFAAKDALDQMLRGTTLAASRSKRGILAVYRRNDPNALGAAPSGDRPERQPSDHGEVGTISGHLLRPPGGQSVHGLVVAVEGTGLQTATDAFGRFAVGAVPAGIHALKISGAGYGELAIRGILVQAYTETKLAAETMPAADLPAPAVVQARQQRDVLALAKYEVLGRRPFVDENMDIVRTMNDPQPYYILNSQQIDQSGATSVGDFLKKRLTMDTTFQASSQNYYATGNNSSVNLRGLGANETLILIDGRRTAGLSVQGTQLQSDLNGIPLAAIDRIEVLPSSASAIYGGAAVGGVINVVLKKNYSGGELSYGYDSPLDASAPLHTADLSYGLSLEGGKTHLLLTGHYSQGQPLLAQDRPELFRRGLANILRNDPSFLHSPTTPFPGATPNIASANGADLVLKDGTPLHARITSVPAGTAPGADAAAGLLANAGQYNLEPGPGSGLFGLQNYFALAPRGRSGLVKLRREMRPWLEAFGSFSRERNTGVSQRNLLSFRPLLVPAAAPGNPFQQNVRVSFPMTFPVPYRSRSDTDRVTAGFVASLPHEWKAELDYTWSKSSIRVQQRGFDSAALRAALLSGEVNPFVDTVAHPLDLAKFTGDRGFDGRSTLNDLGLRASGTVGWLPGVETTLTLGLEHRKEGNADSRFISLLPLNPANDLIVQFFGQSQSTNSAYLEAHLPLVPARKATRFLRALDVQLAARVERYVVSVGTPFAFVAPVEFQEFQPPQGVHRVIRYTSSNPTIGLQYQPAEALTLRASFAKAFLPPTPDQLLPDPTPGPAPETIFDPATGLTYDVETRFGGNPALQPQTSRTLNLGLIWEPHGALAGLRVNLERYRISQPNRISVPRAQQVVSNASLAGRVTRDPATGLITALDLSFLNAEKFRTAGWDASLAYRKTTEAGTFDLYALATVVSYDKRQFTAGSELLNYVGYPAEGGVGKRKGNLTLTWERRAWTLGWTATYFSGYRQAFSPGSPGDLQIGGGFDFYTAPQGGDRIPSQNYHEVFVRYAPGKGGESRWPHWATAALRDLTLQAGVKNVFNTLPPFDVFFDPYFYSTFGDPRLRSLWFRIKKSF